MIAALVPYYEQSWPIARLCAESVTSQGMHLVMYRDGGTKLPKLDGMQNVTHIGSDINRGRGQAFNALLDHVSSRPEIEWFTWLGSDDLLENRFVTEAEKYLSDRVLYVANEVMRRVDLNGSLAKQRIASMMDYLDGRITPSVKFLNRSRAYPAGHQVGQIFRNVSEITSVRFVPANRGSDKVWTYDLSKAIGKYRGTVYRSEAGAYIYFYGGEKDDRIKYRGETDAWVAFEKENKDFCTRVHME